MITTPRSTYRTKPYDFPARVATPDRARRELHRLEASQGQAHAHGDVRAVAYLARRAGRVVPYLKPQRQPAPPSTSEDPS